MVSIRWDQKEERRKNLSGEEVTTVTEMGKVVRTMVKRTTLFGNNIEDVYDPSGKKTGERHFSKTFNDKIRIDEYGNHSPFPNKTIILDKKEVKTSCEKTNNSSLTSTQKNNCHDYSGSSNSPIKNHDDSFNEMVSAIFIAAIGIIIFLCAPIIISIASLLLPIILIIIIFYLIFAMPEIAFLLILIIYLIIY